MSRHTPSLMLAALLTGCVGSQPASATAATTIVFTADTAGTLAAARLDPTTGALTQVAAVVVGEPLEFLALHPGGHLVYALGRQRVLAFAFDAHGGTLTPRGSAPTRTRGTHLEIDRSGRLLLVASYGEHLLTLLPLDEDGRPGPPLQQVGGPDDPAFCRNAHQTRVDPRNRFAFVPCLGSDHVAVLRLDATRSVVTPLPPARTGTGTGPRHLDFHPGLDVLYVLNERQSSVCVFAIDPGTGALQLRQTISALPAGTAAGSRSSDLQVSPDGRFVYAINREPRDEVVVFAVGADGTLAQHARTPTGGAHARTLAIDDGGRWLLTANVRSADLSRFRIAADGTLLPLAPQPTGSGVMSVRMRRY